jgi:hypothetical protein
MIKRGGKRIKRKGGKNEKQKGGFPLHDQSPPLHPLLILVDYFLAFIHLLPLFPLDRIMMIRNSYNPNANIVQHCPDDVPTPSSSVTVISFAPPAGVATRRSGS